MEEKGILAQLNPLGIINSALGIGQSFVDRQTQKLNQDRQNRMNIALAEKSYQHDIDMWNRQNQYNSPAAQMQRFKDANLNPNLMYGQGSSGNATTLPRYQTPSVSHNVQPLDMTDVIGRYQDVAIRQAQIDNLKAQKDLTDKKIATEEVRPEWLAEIMSNLKSRTELSSQQWGFNEINRPAMLEYNRMRALDAQTQRTINLYKLEAEKYGWTAGYTQSRIRSDANIKKSILQNYQLDVKKKQADIQSAEWWSKYYNAINPATQRWIDNISGGVKTLTSIPLFKGGKK